MVKNSALSFSESAEFLLYHSETDQTFDFVQFFDGFTGHRRIQIHKRISVIAAALVHHIADVELGDRIGDLSDDIRDIFVEQR